MGQEKISKTIMIVEDDVFVMDIYQTKLEKEGYKVIMATNGLEAIKKLEEGVRPNLILLDIVMPFMNGLEVLKRINEDEEFKKISVVLLTNLNQKEEIQAGFDLGSKDYIIKSHFTPSEVIEKVNKFLE